MALTGFKTSKAKPKDRPFKLADGGGVFCWLTGMAQCFGGKSIGIWEESDC